MRRIISALVVGVMMACMLPVFVYSAVESTVYTITEASDANHIGVISNIPAETPVDTFKGNLTGATIENVYNNDGSTVKTSPNIQTGDRLKLTDGTMYVLYLEDVVLYEDFNTNPVNGVTINSNYKAVARPADGVVQSYSAAVAVGEGQDRAMLSEPGKSVEGIKAILGNQTGIVAIEWDLRLEGYNSNTTDGSGYIRHMLVSGENNSGGNIYMLTSGGTNDVPTKHRLRPAYGGSNDTTNKNETWAIDYNIAEWIHVKIICDTDNQQVQVLANDVPQVHNPVNTGLVNGAAWFNSATPIEAVNNLIIRNNNAAVVNSFIVDNLLVYKEESSVVPSVPVSSEAYTVDGLGIGDIPLSTPIDNFKSNIEVEGNYRILDKNLNEKTEGIIDNGDYVVLESDGSRYTLKLTNYINVERFNGDTELTTTVLSPWKQIKRPEDGATIDEETVVEATDSENGAILAKTKNNAKASIAAYGKSGEINIDVDFRLEGKRDSITSMRLVDVIMGNEGGSGMESKVAMTIGTCGATTFQLRPMANSAPGISTLPSAVGPALDYRTWHKLGIVINTITDRVSFYINGDPLGNYVDVPFYQDKVADDVTRLEFYNANTTDSISNFIIDNVIITENETPAIPVSTVYNIDHAAHTIKNIPAEHTVADINNNITLSKEGTFTIHDEFGAAKSSGQVALGDYILVNGSDKYVLWTAGIVGYSNFNDGQLPEGWSAPTTRTFPDKSGVSGDKYMRVTSNNTSRTVRTLGSLVGDYEVKIDFFMENSTNTKQVKHGAIFNQGNAEVVNAYLDSGKLGTAYTEGGTYPVRSLSDVLVQGRWYTERIVVSTESDRYSMYMYDHETGTETILVENAMFAASATADNLKEMRFYVNSSDPGTAEPDPINIDNVIIRQLSDQTTATSDLYTVEDDTITGVSEDSVEAVKTNITLPRGATAEIYSSYEDEGDKILRQGNVRDNDKLVVKAENLRNIKVYTLRVSRNVEVQVVNADGSPVVQLADITGGSINVKANVINNGLNPAGDFTIIVVFFDGYRMLGSHYEKLTVANGSTAGIQFTENKTVPTGCDKIRAFVWDTIGVMKPLSTPYMVPAEE